MTIMAILDVTISMQKITLHIDNHKNLHQIEFKEEFPHDTANALRKCIFTSAYMPSADSKNISA